MWMVKVLNLLYPPPENGIARLRCHNFYMKAEPCSLNHWKSWKIPALSILAWSYGHLLSGTIYVKLVCKMKVHVNRAFPETCNYLWWKMDNQKLKDKGWWATKIARAWLGSCIHRILAINSDLSTTVSFELNLKRRLWKYLDSVFQPRKLFTAGVIALAEKWLNI